MRERTGQIVRFGCVLIVALAASCSTSMPEIAELKYQQNVIDDRTRGIRYEKLSVFIHVADDDGIEDLDRLVIRHDTTGLSWEFTPSDWTVFTRGEETWIGSNGILMNDYSQLPPGLYIIELSDLAGYTTEREFSLPASRTPPERVPAPRVTAGSNPLTVSSDLPVAALFYAADGSYIGSAPVVGEGGGSGTVVPNVRNSGRISTVYLYSYVAGEGTGIFSGPYNLPRD